MRKGDVPNTHALFDVGRGNLFSKIDHEFTVLLRIDEIFQLIFACLILSALDDLCAASHLQPGLQCKLQ